MTCKTCGTVCPDTASFCASCGSPLKENAGAPVSANGSLNIGSVKDGVQKFLSTVTGDSGAPVVSFRELFSETFKKHSKEDMDALLVSGTEAAQKTQVQWRKPWLYFRVLAVLGICFLLMSLTYSLFAQSAANIIPGMIFMGAMTVPVSLMVFFWEINKMRNISLFDVIKVFCIGGALSLFLTFVIQPILQSAATGGRGFGSALLLAAVIGIAEEAAKALAVIVFARGLKGNSILNGLLLGAAVGAGFAVFETAGYASFNADMQGILIQRGITSIGTHVLWAAISGAAVMMAKKGDKLAAADILTPKFLLLFAVSVVLHTLWDFLAFTASSPIVLWGGIALLIAAVWVFTIKLINSGLRQSTSVQAENP